MLDRRRKITDCKKKLAAEFGMKNLGSMHYFLGLEVWQSPKKIFLNQGKYVVEILKRFDMLECKAMTTPMETNLKLLVDTSSELVDDTLYRHYLFADVSDEYHARYMLCFEHLESVSGGAETCSPRSYKACDEIP
jgi:hypothetical protein